MEKAPTYCKIIYMPRGPSRNANLTKELLLTLAKVGCFAIAATSPYFLHNFLKAYFKDKNRKVAYRRAERLHELRKKKIVSFKESPNGTVKIELTQDGRRWVRQYNINDLKIKKPLRWDKKWRLIFYDIPHYHKKARDAFREKLKQLGLYQLQKSVWLSAYDCYGEIEFLSMVFNINMENIFYLEVDKLPNDYKLKQWFGLV